MRHALIILTALTACQAPKPAIVGFNPNPKPSPAAQAPAPAPSINKADPPMSKPKGTYREYLTARRSCTGATYFGCMALAGWQYDPSGYQPPSRP